MSLSGEPLPNYDMVVLVATGSQRLLMISKKEESQLGELYKAVKQTKGDR